MIEWQVLNLDRQRGVHVSTAHAKQASVRKILKCIKSSKLRLTGTLLSAICKRRLQIEPARPSKSQSTQGHYTNQTRFVSGMRQMVSFELGKENEKDVFRLVTSMVQRKNSKPP